MALQHRCSNREVIIVSALSQQENRMAVEFNNRVEYRKRRLETLNWIEG